MSVANPIDRLKSLIEYAKDTARLRTSPVQSVDNYKAHFLRHEAELSGLPGLFTNSIDIDGEEVWLKVERLSEIQPPVPNSGMLTEWIEISKLPSIKPILNTKIKRAASLPTEPGKTNSELQSRAYEDAFLEEQENYLAIQQDYNIYLKEWTDWSTAEILRRRTIALYGELYKLSQILQGDLTNTPLELVWGIGIGIMKPETTTCSFPLLTQLVEITLQESDMSLIIRPRATAPRLELELYDQLGNPGVPALAAAGKKFFQEGANPVNPFMPSTYEGLLKSAVAYLDPNGVYYPDKTSADDRSLPSPQQSLTVTDTWVIFARPRSNNLFIGDLERFEASLPELPANLSKTILALVTDPSYETEEVALPSFRGLSYVNGSEGYTTENARELYFPLPFNDEQVQIIQNLEVHTGVVVQGPPGTGKTHTIANIICHYLASGKRVLVTSMKDPALKEVQNKLPEDIRALTISLLTNEADGMKQFEHAIDEISSGIQRTDRTALTREIKQIDEEIDSLHASIRSAHRTIAEWAQRNLSAFTIDGESLKPVEAAREAVDYTDDISWIQDKVGIEERYRPQFDNSDIVDLRHARHLLGANIKYLGLHLPQIAAFPDSHQLQQVHGDLQQIAALKEREQDGHIPPLQNVNGETIEKANECIVQLQSLIRKTDDLKSKNATWLTELTVLLRRAEKDDILDILDTLIKEIERAETVRKEFLKRPLDIPAEVETDSELLSAIENLSTGEKPFGLLGLFGKKHEKQLLERITILGSKPKDDAEWQHVLHFLKFQLEVKKLLIRWNAMTSELPIPSVAVMLDGLSIVGRHIDNYKQACGILTEEEICRSLVSSLIPTWAHAEKIGRDDAAPDQAISILTHHVSSYRLTQTINIRNSFEQALAGCQGEITEQIHRFFTSQLGNPDVTTTEILDTWSSLISELRHLIDLRPQFETVTHVTSRIEKSGAPIWADALRFYREHETNNVLLPDNWKEAWRMKRITNYLQSIDSRQVLKSLSESKKDMEQRLAVLYKKAVINQTWLKLSQNASHGIRASLEVYRAAIRKIGKGTGIRASRYRNDARQAAESASSAIPCWIMPHYRICESLPAIMGNFDLVIIDEASQSDMAALPAILRAEKILVVGDDRQVSPEAVGMKDDKVVALMQSRLIDQVELYRPLMAPDQSIYDLFKTVFSKGTGMLREHFRCVAPIIEYSKKTFYAHKLIPLRLPKRSERLDPPLIDVLIESGFYDGKINREEARYIVDEIKRIIEDPAMSNRSIINRMSNRSTSIGVVSLLGEHQAGHIMKMLSEEVELDDMIRFDITCGDAKTFQGKERDIMFVTMVASVDNSGKGPHALSGIRYDQRFNVAASRARDRMYLVRSVEIDNLSPADTLRRGLIEHFKSPFAQDAETVQDLRKLCESPFEFEMFDLLTERGYKVTPQVAVGGFRIDFVVEGENDNRLAIECDGDRYHGPDKWEDDMRRQRILERAGWTFWRCFASTFVMQREQVIYDLINTLIEHDIKPMTGDKNRPSIHSELRVVKSAAPVVDLSSSLFPEN